MSINMNFQLLGLCVSNTNFLANHQSDWKSSKRPCKSLNSWLTHVDLPSRKKTQSGSAKKLSLVLAQRMWSWREDREGYGRAICWGLQGFVGALHNRKLGSHCLQALKQQAYPVSPPLWPCDNDRDMWPITDKRPSRVRFFWGKECIRFWIPSIFALWPLLLRCLMDGRLLPWLPNDWQHPEFTQRSRMSSV